MKTILSGQTLHIPEDVHITLKGRSYCRGPQRNPAEGLQSYQCRAQSPWKERRGCGLTNGGETKDLATVHTVCSQGQNTTKGVTLGFRYEMSSVYAHFLINIQENGSLIEIRNVLGEKYIQRVRM
ncbi:60S ribosomal protein L9 [Tupaia chinensis]|uniref:60S ribosomal protein L9 n=1 Tax=Tupaia chinensis TaxID=246437 RepID=L9L1J0_TUPCH|nr:60S ribosomal protein L9 [Tupaia chinensis]